MIGTEDRDDFLTLFADSEPNHIEVILSQLSQLGYKVNITVDATGRAWADDFHTHADGRTIHEALKRYVNKIAYE